MSSIDPTRRQQIRAAASAMGCEDVEGTVRALRQGDAGAADRLAGALLWSALACPAATAPLYDRWTAAWLGEPVPGAAPDWGALPFCPLPGGFWQALWQLADDAPALDAGGVTARVAALGAELDAGFLALAEAVARDHSGAADAASRPLPARTDAAVLAACPPDSLGGTLHRMIVDNGYDLEVLDREALALEALPPAQRYLNTRILQMHDVWHLVAGYETTASHEIAISAFQLAQFGHDYSARFLAVVMALGALRGEGLAVLAQLIAEGWRHGRRTPTLMAVPWEQCWEEPIPALRERLGVAPLHSALPADLFEAAGTG